MLPVTTGFIFPDGTNLDSGTKGHRKTAYRYIVDHNFLKTFNEYERKTSGGEDDFLIECLGAVKICHYCGVHYIYVPKLHGTYIDSIEKLYKTAGYKVCYYSTNISLSISVSVQNLNVTSYNQTVVCGIDNYGEKCLIYNPNRIGD